MGNNIVSAVSGSEELYTSIRGCVISAQKRVYAAVNSAMVAAYGAQVDCISPRGYMKMLLEAR